jgi:hypothetical protein
VEKGGRSWTFGEGARLVIFKAPHQKKAERLFRFFFWQGAFSASEQEWTWWSNKTTTTNYKEARFSIRKCPSGG